MKTRSRPEPNRPHGAPAYYLGRPASLWLTALAPRSQARPQVWRANAAGEIRSGVNP